MSQILYTHFQDKLRAFICKLQLWLRDIEENNYSAFATLQSFVEYKQQQQQQNMNIRAMILENIKTHLHMLIDEFNRYFPEYTE